MQELRTKLSRAEAQVVEVVAKNEEYQRQIVALRHDKNTEDDDEDLSDFKSYKEITLELAAKTKAMNEMESKLRSLADKMKDMMQRYAGEKSKNGALEKELARLKEEQANGSFQQVDGSPSPPVTATERQHLTPVDESSAQRELVKLKMKLENVEQRSEDNKIKYNEMMEKYNESQREVTRLKGNLQDYSSRLQTLDAEKSSLERMMQAIQDAKDRVATELTNRATASDSDFEAYKQQTENTKATLETELREERSKVFNLELQLTNIVDKLGSESQATDVLEDYKKRAQVALKKANNNVSALTSENNKLKSRAAQLEQEHGDQTEQIAAVEQSLVVLADQKKQIFEEYNQCKAQLKSEINQHQGLRRAFEAISAKLLAVQEQLGTLQEEAITSHVLIKYDGNDDVKMMNGSLDASIGKSEVTNKTKRSFQPAQIKELKRLQAEQMGSNENELFGVDSESTASPRQQRPSTNTQSWAVEASRHSYNDTEDTGTVSSSSGRLHQHTVSPHCDSDGRDRRPGSEALSLDGNLIDDGSAGSMFSEAIKEKFELLRIELAQRGIDLEAAYQELEYEREEKKR